MNIVILCVACEEQWDVDMDPVHCICDDPPDSDWILYTYD
jgi:hypothetical protein